MPNFIGVVLPASGKYKIIVAEHPRLAHGKAFRGTYCLTLESSKEAAQSLKATSWVERLIAN